jgi:thiol-disulfide isomerase/thioredoxin
MPSPIIVGKVYANWCGHCQHLKPEWKALKKSLSNARVKFIEIEESESAKRAHFEKKNKIQLDVNGFPTIFKIHTNKPVEYYTGPRTADAMRAWIGVPSPKKQTRRNIFKRPIKNKSQKRWLTFL